MKKKNAQKYNAWKEYLTSTRDKTEYSQRRMDLLIISISSAGIYIVFETFKWHKTNKIEIHNIDLLFWIGVFFAIGIVINFISQLSGYYANKNEENYIQVELTMLEKKKVAKDKKKKYKEEQENYDNKINRYNRLTHILNISSILLMVIGLSCLVYFNYSIF